MLEYYDLLLFDRKAHLIDPVTRIHTSPSNFLAHPEIEAIKGKLEAVVTASGLHWTGDIVGMPCPPVFCYVPLLLHSFSPFWNLDVGFPALLNLLSPWWTGTSIDLIRLSNADTACAQTWWCICRSGTRRRHIIRTSNFPSARRTRKKRRYRKSNIPNDKYVNTSKSLLLTRQIRRMPLHWWIELDSHWPLSMWKISLFIILRYGHWCQIWEIWEKAMRY